MPTAYSYLRFSTPEQSQGDSYRRQTELADLYAAKHGLTIDTHLRMADEGVSAFRARNVRQGALGKFLRAIDEGLVAEGSYLLVENLDRLSRANPWDAMPIFQQIISAGVTIVTLQDERTWSAAELRDNPYRIFESLLVMIRANQESEVKSRRLKAAWRNKRQNAALRPLTSIAPAWLRLTDDRKHFEVVEDRAQVVRRIFSLTLEGVGQNRIAETLNGEGVPCFGKAAYWHRSYVKKLLENPAVVGTMVPHVVEHPEGKRVRTASAPVEGYFPAVVSEEVYQRVRAQMLGGRTTHVKYAQGKKLASLLAGLARCPKCEGTMTRVSKGPKGGNAYLVCAAAKVGAGCRYKAVPQSTVEEALISNAGWLIAEAPSGNDEIDNKLSNVTTAISVMEEEVSNLVASLAERASTAVNERLADSERELARLRQEELVLVEQQGAATGPMLQRRLDDLLVVLETDPPPVELTNTRLRQVFNAVTVNYLTGSLELQWKQGAVSTIFFAWPEEGDA